MTTKKERLMNVIEAELERQYESGGLSYLETDQYNSKAFEVEGRLDIEFLTDAILEYLR
jgi:hypothetical protein